MEFPILLKTVCLLLKMGGLPTKIFGKGVGAGFADKCGHNKCESTFHRKKTILVYLFLFSTDNQTSLTCLGLMSQTPIFILLGMSDLGEILTQQMSRTLNVEVT